MRKPEPVELVAIYVPEFVKAVVVAFAIGVAMLWVAILSKKLPPPTPAELWEIHHSGATQ
jgi:hypothetical protein